MAGIADRGVSEGVEVSEGGEEAVKEKDESELDESNIDSVNVKDAICGGV